MDRVCESIEVLARLARREHQHVRALLFVARPFRRETLVHAGVGDDDALAQELQVLRHVVRRVLAVDHDHVASPRRVPVLGEVLPPGARVHQVGEVQRHEIVDQSRAHAVPLGRVHPVGEVEDVQRPREPLHWRVAGMAPGRSPEVRRGRQRDDALRDVEVAQRRLHRFTCPHADDAERDQLVPALSSLGQAP